MTLEEARVNLTKKYTGKYGIYCLGTGADPNLIKIHYYDKLPPRPAREKVEEAAKPFVVQWFR